MSTETIIKLAEEKANLLVEVDRLNRARLKDAIDSEDAMRVLIKIISDRADTIEHLTDRVQVWMETAFRLNRKNNALESKSDTMIGRLPR